MKKTSTLVFMSFLAIAATAQDIQKGTIFLGGNIGYSRETNDSDQNAEKIKNSAFSFNPSAGKFYRNNRLVGVNLSYSRHKKSDNSQEGNYYGVGLFLRQYIPIGKSFYLFVEEGLFGQTGKLKEDVPSVIYRLDRKYTGIELYAFPGIAYAVTRKLQFELAFNRLLNINYSTQKEYQENQSIGTHRKTSNFSVQSGAFDSSVGALTIGAQWTIR
jgi:hypothetical protein